MIYVVCSVRDRASNTFGPPIFTVSVGSAIRSFSDAVSNSADESNMMSKHPGDYDLFHLGTYHDDHARFELLDAPLQIAIGKDSVRVPGPTGR